MSRTLTPARRAAAIAFGVAAVVVLGLLTYLTTRRVRTATAWVGHTYAVLAELEAVQARAVDAETGVRGYAATGVDRFLDPYSGAQEDARTTLAELRRLTADNPAQQPRLDTVDVRLTRLFAHLDSTVQLVRERRLAPRVGTASLLAGKQRMDDVRAALSAAAAEERRLLAAREAEERRIDAITATAVAGETLAAATCVLVVGLLLAAVARRERAHALAEREARAEAERMALQLQDQAVELESTISELQAQTATAEQAQRDAEIATRARTELLSTVSHELRTPLNAIGGYAELLSDGLRGPVSDAQRADLDRIRRANRYLTSLVSDLLNFSRLEARRVTFDLASVPIAPLVADLHTLLGPQFAAKSLVFVHHDCEAGDGEGSWTVRADAEKLRQVLLNLLSNAIKFTEPGGRVALGCERDAAAGVARLRVSDSGRGIPAGRLEHVFEPFVQIDRHRTPESQQGVGLGLAISRDLARGMGGDLTATSAEGVGSTFTLTMPLG